VDFGGSIEYWIFDGSRIRNRQPDLSRIVIILADRVEAETDPEKIEWLGTIYCELNPPEIVTYPYTYAKALASLLREAKEPKDRLSAQEIVDSWPQWQRDMLGGIGYMIDSRIADHEAKKHTCPHCGKEKG
jgi:hypothetical protein